MFDWTAERVEFLLAGYNSGNSMARIAGLLGGGLSRNAVIGKLRRMGHHRGRMAVAPKKPRRTRAAARTDQATKGRVNRTTNFNRKVRAKVLAGDDDLALDGDGMHDLPPDQSPDAVCLLEATEEQCRWPLGEPKESGFLFCGAPIMNGLTLDSRPYCSRHYRVATK